jgi:hypothetical protein
LGTTRKTRGAQFIYGYGGAADKKCVRLRINERHGLEVWRHAGPYVQTVLVQKIRKMDRSHIDPVQPVLLEVLGEALKAEVRGVSSTYKSVTLRQGSAAPSDALARMRAEAIDLLMEL